MRRSLFTNVAATLAFGAAAAFAQAPVGQPLTFDVASIKPSALPDQAKIMSGQFRAGMSVDGARVDLRFMSLADLVRTAGISTAPGVRQPRWHDFRHTFAVSTLLQWYRAGVDVQSRVPQLSTWLGHVDPASTYWYLQASPELLALAAGLLEQSSDGE